MRSRRVVVVGGGNAGLCAALAACEAGATVTLVEFAPEAARGGNSAYAGGLMRVPYEDASDLRGIMPDFEPDEASTVDLGSYPAAAFYEDMGRVTDYRCDPDLVEVLVSHSRDTLEWMRGHGVRFLPAYGHQSFKVDGRRKFWGGLPVEVSGGGGGLVAALSDAVCGFGAKVLYRHRAIGLVTQRGRVSGVCVSHDGDEVTLPADGVVIASGGFEANAEWRTRYLGAGWELAKVRGSRFNVGDGIRMALELGAVSWGHWSGCHAVAWDARAPDFGLLSVGDGFQKHSYPFGILVNTAGHRFVDEGEDFRNFTYAKYGVAILHQPGRRAWQVFDAQAEPLLRDEYRIPQVTRVTAQTLRELAGGLEGMDVDSFLKTVHDFNRAVNTSVPFNPTVKDGRCTRGLTVPKSNWAVPIECAPFAAYEVTCGITFTFGGVRIDPHGAVQGIDGRPIDGLFACGEAVGGLYYFNYPGGTGLTAGATFGRAAGRNAAGG